MITDKNAVVASYEDSGTKRNEQIIIAPNYEKEYSLNEFLESVLENMIHSEFDSGQPVGREIW